MNLPENDYHRFPAWSYSMISDYAKNGFSAISTLHDAKAPTPSMEFGSLFDSILTRGKATLDEYVIDSTDTSCPPAEREVFDKIISLGFGEYSYENLASMHMGSLVEIMNSCKDFCSKYKKEETKFANLEKNKAYYELHRTGKKVVSKHDWDEAVEMARVFRSNEFLNNLFGTKNTEDIEYIYQAQFLVKFKTDGGQNIPLKCMFDLLKIDHSKKTIQPVDLKTSAMPAYDFAENFLKFRYDLQGSLYTDILEAKLADIPEYADYTILPFIFVDISRSDKVPVSYTYDPRAEDQVTGFSYTIKDKTYKCKHWSALLGEIIDYEQARAVVPEGISLEKPNSILDAISRL